MERYNIIIIVFSKYNARSDKTSITLAWFFYFYAQLWYKCSCGVRCGIYGQHF